MNGPRQHTADLSRLLQLLQRRIGVLLITALLVPAAAFVFSIAQEKRYTTEATLLFRDPQLGQQLFGTGLSDQITDERRQAATNLELVSLDVVANDTAADLGKGFTESSVKNAITIESTSEADVVSITASATDPRTAARLANTYAQDFIKFRRDADREKVAEAKDLIDRRLNDPARDLDPSSQRELERRLQQLDILTSLQTGNAELVQTAEVPSSPSSPLPMRNTIFGAIFGVILGIGMVFLVDRLDRRLRDPEEVGDLFGRPILATVPASDELVDPHVALPAGPGEAFRMLRANLRYFNVDQNVKSVLVTSPMPGDGKSTVAWNLASAAAAARINVLLIEADLRRPTLSRWMQERPQLGLSGLLSHQGDLSEAVTRVSFGEGSPTGPTHELDVIFAGALPPNPDELMESDRMREILRTAEENYGLVVVDTPPTSVVSDAVPLVKEVSGVLVVARLNRTSRGAAAHLARQLHNLNARVLGVVVNDLRARSAAYGYGYGYAYEYSAAETPGVDAAPASNGSSNGSGAGKRESVH